MTGYSRVTLVVLLWALQLEAATHWAVTSDGMIQAQESVYTMSRPFSLMAVQQQRARVQELTSLKRHLQLTASSLDDIDTSTDFVTLHKAVLETDADCIQTGGKSMDEIDFHLSTLLPITKEMFNFKKLRGHLKQTPTIYKVPDCTKGVTLDFSMLVDHLEGYRDRAKLTMQAERALASALFQAPLNGFSLDEFGHVVAVRLKTEPRSWVLHNLAAFYWRILGNATSSIECLRRALHFAPPQHRPVAQVSLANVFQKAGRPNDAVTLLRVAIWRVPLLTVVHFTLANVYSTLEKYQLAVDSYSACLSLQPQFATATLYRGVIKCHLAIRAAMERQTADWREAHAMLQEKQTQYRRYKRLAEELQSEQTGEKGKREARDLYENWLIQARRDNKIDYCSFDEDTAILDCPGTVQRGDVPPLWQVQTEERVAQLAAIASNRPRTTDALTPSWKPLYSAWAELPTRPPLYMLGDYPPEEDCNYQLEAPRLQDFPIAYLPPQNKGFNVSVLLNEGIGLSSGSQHALPWYPPTCGPAPASAARPPLWARNILLLDGLSEQRNFPARRPQEACCLRGELLRLLRPWVSAKKAQKLTEPAVEEVGQRLATALSSSLRPSWLLLNTAALYWLVIGNLNQAATCLRRALYETPETYADVTLVNLASVLYRGDSVDDALEVALAAFAISPFEPATNKLLGTILSNKGNHSGGVHHYRLALRQDPSDDQPLSFMTFVLCHMQSREVSGGSSKCPAAPTEDFHSCIAKASSEQEVNKCREVSPACHEPCSKIAELQQGASLGELLASLGREQLAQLSECGCIRAASAGGEMALELARKIHSGSCEGGHCTTTLFFQDSSFVLLIEIDAGGQLSQQYLLQQFLPAKSCYVAFNGSVSKGCSSKRFKSYAGQIEEVAARLREISAISPPSQVAPELSKQHLRPINTATDMELFIDDIQSTLLATQSMPVFNAIQIWFAEADLKKKPFYKERLAERLAVPPPSMKSCQAAKTEKESPYLPLTLIPLQLKGVKISEHLLDLPADWTLAEPYCDPTLLSEQERDGGIHFVTLSTAGNLTYTPELELHELLAKLTSDAAIELFRSRLAYSLERRPGDWVLAHLAGLYWRMKGSATNALKCLAVAVNAAPSGQQDVALVSLSGLLSGLDLLSHAAYAAHLAVVTGQPASHHAMLQLANVFVRMEEYGAAVMTLEAGLAKDANQPVVSTLLHQTHCVLLRQRARVEMLKRREQRQGKPTG